MLDFVAWSLTYASTLMLGWRWREGWLLLAAGALCWAVVGWRARYGKRRVWALVLGSAVTFGTAIANFLLWER